MDDQTRYAFCVEMAMISKELNDIDGLNEWYAKAWYYLQKNSDDGIRLEGFKIIKDNRNE